MANKGNEWARSELGNAMLGDKRLTDRLVNIADRLISMPESSIRRLREQKLIKGFLSFKIPVIFHISATRCHEIVMV